MAEVHGTHRVIIYKEENGVKTSIASLDAHVDIPPKRWFHFFRGADVITAIKEKNDAKKLLFTHKMELPLRHHGIVELEWGLVPESYNNTTCYINKYSADFIAAKEKEAASNSWKIGYYVISDKDAMKFAGDMIRPEHTYSHGNNGPAVASGLEGSATNGAPAPTRTQRDAPVIKGSAGGNRRAAFMPAGTYIQPPTPIPTSSRGGDAPASTGTARKAAITTPALPMTGKPNGSGSPGGSTTSGYTP